MKVKLISSIWCPSCIIMRPRYDKIKKDFGFELEELDFDIDDIERYNVGNVLPVAIIEKEGNEVMRLVGEKSLKELNKVFIELG